MRSYRFASFELRPAARQLLAGGMPLALGARAFDLLLALVERAGDLVTKDELLDLVWPDVVVEENNLQVHVSALRKLLGRDAIATIPGRGYRFTLEIEGARPAVASLPPAADAGLIGRDDDLTELLERMRRAQVTTLAGPGGIGKTALARSALARWGTTQTIWVELGGVTEPGLVGLAVAGACGIPADAGEALAAAVAAKMGPGQVLALDNAEHLVEGVARFVAQLQRVQPAPRVLVTSQAPLHVPGEEVMRLEPLDAVAAAELFCIRARALLRRFEPDDDGRALLQAICVRLDHNPLAIEMAVGRLPLFGLRQLAACLDERFRALSTSARMAPQRQQTLHAVLDWSASLLAEDERRFFIRLGAFPAEFTLEDAVSLAGDFADAWAVADLTATLIDRSLVWPVPGPARMDYRLPETSRAWARAALGETGRALELACCLDWLEADGDEHAARGDYAQAMSSYGAAIELGHALAGAGQSRKRLLDLYLKLGPAIQTVLGPAATQCEDVYRTASELAHRQQPDLDTFKAEWGYWHFLAMAGRDREAARCCAGLVDMALVLQDESCELEACHANVSTHQLLGRVDDVVAYAQRARFLYKPELHHALTHTYGGHDPGVCVSGQASIALWLQGRPQEALAMAEDALRQGEELQHGYSRAVAYYYTAMTFHACAETARFAQVVQALAELSVQAGMDMLKVEAALLLGRARVDAGSVDEGIAAMQGAFAAIEAKGDFAFIFFYAALLADSLLMAGHVEHAHGLLARVLKHAESGQAFYLPEIYRLLAHALHARGDDAAAAAQAARAIDEAERLGATSLRARAQASAAALAQK